MIARRIVGALSWVLVLLVLAIAAERWQEQAGARKLPAPGRFVEVGGRKVHLLCAGSGRPTVLLEATGVGSSLQYQHILPALGLETTTCAYDRAGMGFSEPASGSRSAQDMTDDLVGALSAASVEGPYVLVAGSLGGLVAELFARERPQDVSGFVALDALTTESADDPVFGSLRTKACTGRWAAEIGLLRLADPFGLGHSDPVAFEVTYRASTWRTICQSLRDLPETSLQLRAAPPLRADLPLTVIVHGEPRGLIPMASPEEERAAEPAWIAAQRAFAARSTRSRFVVAAGSGHVIVEERPDLVVAEAKAILDATRPAP